MTGQDFLSTLKEQVREELDKKADETIENLADKLRDELRKHKTSLIAEMLGGIEVVANENRFNREITFQINIKAGRSDTE